LFGFEGPVRAQDFISLCRGDIGQLRFIFSPAAGARVDFQAAVRRLMARMEKDCEMPLAWVAAVHHDTPHRHAHVVVRGVLDSGERLVLTKTYWTHGLEARARGIVTAMLGPTAGVTPLTLEAVKGWLRQRSEAKEFSHG
jgi:type IV secretory pathway VirD2 relaxase